MPSLKKTLYFMSSALLSAGAAGLLGFSMSEKWSETTVMCANTGKDIFNGSASFILMIFEGKTTRFFCPGFAGGEDFKIFQMLGRIGGAPLVVHSLVVGLLILCLFTSTGSILISLYNSVSNPYQTYLGPIGFYICSSLSACLSFVVLILVVVNVFATSIAEDAIKLEQTVELKQDKTEMQLGFYLLIPYTALSLLAILSIYLYDHAAYTHQKEQQKPTEDTPKEIMMY